MFPDTCKKQLSNHGSHMDHMMPIGLISIDVSRCLQITIVTNHRRRRRHHRCRRGYRCRRHRHHRHRRHHQAPP